MAAQQTERVIHEIAAKYAEALRTKMRLSRLYVYGSHATGGPDADSDIDIAVVADGLTGDVVEDTFTLMKMRREVDMRIEPHPFLTSEFTEKNPLAREVMRTGIRIVQSLVRLPMDGGDNTMARVDAVIEMRARRAIEVLSRSSKVAAAYLFGSHVEGTVHPWSDVDLAVFAENLDSLDLCDRARVTARIQKQAGDEVDIHLLPAEDLIQRDPASFSAWVLAHGVEIRLDRVPAKREGRIVNDVRVEVVEVRGDCSAGLKVGDGFTVRDGVLIEPNGPLCLYAIAALSNYLTGISFERPDSGWITTVDRLQCPDPMSTVVFQITRANCE